MNCPRCEAENLSAARFCSRCGIVLAGDAGRGRHPNPVAAPAGYEPCDDAADLHFKWAAAWGGSVLLGSEPLSVSLFNAGYPLRDVVLRVRGEDEQGAEVFSLEQQAEAVPRGEAVEIEIPSYELAAPARALRVSLVSASYDSEGQDSR